jgi:hypothetical protein
MASGAIGGLTLGLFVILITLLQPGSEDVDQRLELATNQHDYNYGRLKRKIWIFT